MSVPQGVPVFAELPAYQAAAAQLPRTVSLAVSVRGAVAVIPGVGPWWRKVLAARDAGAAAAVVADPLTVPWEAVEALDSPPGIPVIVERPRLRPDVADDALSARAASPATMVSIECAAVSPHFEAVLRDAFGWARLFGGRPDEVPRLSAATATGHGTMVLLDAGEPPESGTPVAVLGNILQGGQAGSLLNVLVLGTTRTAITVDGAAGFTRVETAMGDGTLLAPTRFEASVRLALRRAAEACSSGRDTGDLPALLLDAQLLLDSRAHKQH